MPSPMRKITFIGFSNGVTEVTGGGAVASLVGEQALAMTNNQSTSTLSPELNDGDKFFPRKGFDGSFAFKHEQYGCEFTRSGFRFKS